MQFDTKGELLYTGYADSVKAWDMETPKLWYVLDKTPRTIHDLQVTDEYLYVSENYQSLLDITSYCLQDFENQTTWVDSESQPINRSKQFQEQEVWLDSDVKDGNLLKKGMDFAKKVVGNIWDSKKA